MHSQSENTFNIKEKPESYAAKYSEITGIGCPVWLLFTQAMARQLKLESEAWAPDWASGNFSPARVWAFVLGWQQKPELQTSTPPPSHCGFSRPRGGRRGRSRLQASSENLTRGHSYTGGFLFNKVCLFPPRALGTLCQDRMTHWLPGFASLWETLNQGPSPAEQESSCCLAPRQSRLFRVSLDGNTTQGRFHVRAFRPQLWRRIPLPCLLTSSKTSSVITLHTSLISLHEPTPLGFSASHGQPWMQKYGSLCSMVG